MFEQMGVIGCGLMGGSFALAMKRAGLVKRIVGYSKSPSTTKQALQMGVIDIEAPSALLAVSGADLVVFAVPVSAMEASIKSVRHLVSPTALFMDMGSTKVDVVQAAEKTLGKNIGCFVPAHPIAGSDKSGVAHANGNLFMGKQVILTPTDKTEMAMLNKASALWKALGCRVTMMSPDAHDAAYAAVSHLPHLLAFAYMQGIVTQEQSRHLLSLAGTGFQDFTRIAAADPKIWSDILMANRTELIQQSRHFQRTLHGMEQLLEQGDKDALLKTLSDASGARVDWKLSA